MLSGSHKKSNSSRVTVCYYCGWFEEYESSNIIGRENRKLGNRYEFEECNSWSKRSWLQNYPYFLT